MSLLKYVGEQDDEHNGKLNWPGFLGMPVRGQVGLIKERELEESVEVAYDFHCDEFDLSDPEQRDRYVKIMDRIVNGWYVQRFCDNYIDEVTKKRKVWLEWCQQYGQINPRSQSAITNEGSSIQQVG